MKLLSPSRRRIVVERVRSELGLSERRVCRVLGQHRSTQRKIPRGRADEDALTRVIIGLAYEYGRYGYRRIWALLQMRGWDVGLSRVQRIWRRECLAIHVARSLKHDDVLACLTDLFTRHGSPDHIRSDKGSEFTATAVREWLPKVGVKTLFIEPGSPWENGYNESFNGKLRAELLNGEIFYTLREARVLIEQWRRRYNTVRPHSALGYRPPASEAFLPARQSGDYAPYRPPQEGWPNGQTLS